MNTILDFVYNHNGLIVLLWMLLTAVLILRRLDAPNRILQGLTLVLWLAATAFLTFFERLPVMEIRFNLIPFQDDNFFNVKSNVLLFIPLVPALCILFSKIKVRTAFIAGVLASLAVELVQLVSHRGICDIDDLLENSLGVLIGAVFFLIVRKFRK
ncbi:MAG: VanZ family protein [Clostridia bacterium]|nr:VanZ family protein [Clostridia bacterium]